MIIKMYMSEDLCDLLPSVFPCCTLPTARSKILQSDEVSHSSNQLRRIRGIDRRVKQIKTSLTVL